jgi:hypothetical protein
LCRAIQAIQPVYTCGPSKARGQPKLDWVGAAKRIMNLRSRASVIQPDCARVPLRGSDVSPYRASLSVSRNPLSCAVLGKSDPAGMSERSCAQWSGYCVPRNTSWSA